MELKQTQPRKMGWTKRESELLRAAAEDAKRDGLPLRQVFERVAFETGRKPNSIRNFYYSLMRQSELPGQRREKFTPFAKGETEWLVREILIAKSAGESVRACVHRLAGGEQTLMLRYQNKYRAVLKNRPELIEKIIFELSRDGVEVSSPYRARSQEVASALRRLSCDASGNARILSMIDTLDALVRGALSAPASEFELNVAINQLERSTNASTAILEYVKAFLELSDADRASSMDSFASQLFSATLELENALSQAAQF